MERKFSRIAAIIFTASILIGVVGCAKPKVQLQVSRTTVQQGESVLAVGNPGDAMLFSATKGIVSAVGKFPAFGPGTWIQTDAPINPGTPVARFSIPAAR